MTDITNRKVVEGWMDAIDTLGVREAFERYASEDYKQHNPNAADGRDGAIRYIEAEKARGADMKVKRIVSDGDLILTHSHKTYTDGSLDQTVIDIWRIEDGKLAEHWDVAKDVPKICANPPF